MSHLYKKILRAVFLLFLIAPALMWAQTEPAPYGYGKWSELSQAAYKGDLQTVRELIQSAADIDKKESDLSTTPLIAAVMGKRIEVVKYMLGFELNPDTIRGCMAHAVWYGTHDIFNLLVEKKPDVYWEFLAFEAVKHDKTDYLDIIIENAPPEKLSTVKAYILLAAAGQYNVELVKQMLEEGVPLKIQYYGTYMTPLLMVPPSYTSHDKLYENSMKYDRRDDVVRLLLKAGVDVDAADKDGYTALFLFTNAGYTVPVKILLEAGANPNIPAKNGETALTNALRLGLTNIPAMLIFAGANVNVRTSMGGTIAEQSTPLIIASATGNMDLVKLLAAHGARVNDKDIRGRTALIWSKHRNYTEITEFLLSVGARDVKNIDQYFNQRGR
jgi:ankyrin repeat protein